MYIYIYIWQRAKTECYAKARNPEISKGAFREHSARLKTVICENRYLMTASLPRGWKPLFREHSASTPRALREVENRYNVAQRRFMKNVTCVPYALFDFCWWDLVPKLTAPRAFREHSARLKTDFWKEAYFRFPRFCITLGFGSLPYISFKKLNNQHSTNQHSTNQPTLNQPTTFLPFTFYLLPFTR